MNAITPLKTDHGNVEALFKQFEAPGRDGDPGEKRRVVDHIIEQLSVHASVEEQLVYPLLRERLEDGEPARLESSDHFVVDVDRPLPVVGLEVGELECVLDGAQRR